MRDSTYRLLADDYQSDDDDFQSLFQYDDAWDDGGYDEAAAPAARPRLRPTPFVQRPGPTFKPSPAIGGGAVSGPGGAGGKVQFDRPVATAQAIEQLKADTSKAIAEVRAETTTNLRRIDDRLAATATKVESLGKTVKAGAGRVGALEQRSQLFALLPFIQGKPKPASITFEGDKEAKKVSTVTYADSQTDILLPLIMMGGLGGSGGGGLGGGDSNMMLLAIALMKP